MASIAQDEIGQSRDTGPSIAAHPAFPLVVALWFAALLGLGSLVVPVALVERIVAVTGISALVPAAAPPLGFTARMAIALIATVLGALLGLLAARRVVGTLPEQARPRPRGRAADPSRRLLQASEDLGDESASAADVAESASARRRPLAIEEDERPREFFVHAPLPGEDPWAEEDPSPTPAAEARDDEETCAEPDEALLDLSDSEVLDAPADEQHASEYRSECEPSEEIMPQDPTFETHAPDLEPVAAQRDANRGAELWENAPPEELGLVQLVQRLGLTLEKHRDRLARQSAERHANKGAVPGDFDPAEADEAAEAMAAYFGRQTLAPETEVLLQESGNGASDGFAPSEESSVPVLPTGVQYQPFAGLGRAGPGNDSHEEGDDEDLARLATSLSLPKAENMHGPQQPSARGHDLADTDDGESYSSLLAVKKPTREAPDQREPYAGPASRPFDPPGGVQRPVVEAVQRPAPSNDDNERALREALLNLQRIGQ